MKSLSRNFTLVLCGSLLLAVAAHSQVLPAADPSGQDAVAAQATQQPSDQVLQLVAPIALYPDALVGQILTAATYPTQIVEASRWLQQHSALNGNALADAVNSQPWDPSVKALIQFPAVLDNMDKNLSWTSALGDAYVNEPDDVTNAVQILRQRAQAAGTLATNSQQTVTTQDQAIDIEPTDPDVVYVPAYDPWLVYGAPLVAYPDWFDVPGVFYDGPDLFFDAGLDLGLFGGFAWGWHHWGFDWHHHAALHDHSLTSRIVRPSRIDTTCSQDGQRSVTTLPRAAGRDRLLMRADFAARRRQRPSPAARNSTPSRRFDPALSPASTTAGSSVPIRPAGSRVSERPRAQGSRLPHSPAASMAAQAVGSMPAEAVASMAVGAVASMAAEVAVEGEGIVDGDLYQ